MLLVALTSSRALHSEGKAVLLRKYNRIWGTLIDDLELS